VISKHNRARRWLALTCFLAGGMMFTLAGCDSEAMLASSNSEQETALRILGSDSAMLMRADVEHQMDVMRDWMPNSDEMTARLEEMMGEVDAHTGIRLDEDVHGVYMGMSGLQENAHIGVLVFIDYDADDVVDRLDAETEVRRIDTEWPVNAFAIGDGSEMAVAFAEGSLIILARGEAHLRTLLDCAYDESAPVAMDDLLTMISEYDSWMIARDLDQAIAQMDLAELQGSASMIRPVVASVQHLAVGTDTNADRISMEVLVDPVDAVDAKDLENLFSGAKAMLRMQVRESKEMSDMVEGIEVGSKSGFVTLEFEIDRADVERLETALRTRMGAN